MSTSYEELKVLGKLVVQADRKLNFLMGPIKSYYGINNISVIMRYAKYYKKLQIKKIEYFINQETGKVCQIHLMLFSNI